jgi:molybdenum cofactor cytidylyltransferase
MSLLAPNISALILAAGSSQRMGQPKQLLEFDGKHLLENVINLALSFPFSEVIAVIGNQADQIQRLIKIDDDRFRWIVNHNYADGQSVSLSKGIKEVGEHVFMMVFLGDQPLIREETIWTVMETGVKKSTQYVNTPYVIQPSFNEKPGHPVFFGNLSLHDFSRVEGDQGARALIKNLESRCLVPVQDAGILIDIDTPEQYEKAKKLLLHDI